MGWMKKSKLSLMNKIGLTGDRNTDDEVNAGLKPIL
jgi:hypothetical protein